MLSRAVLAAALLALSTVRASAGTCITETPFTTAPVELSAVSHIVPLGNLNPEYGHTIPTRHIYVYPKMDAELVLLTPGDVEIVAAVFRRIGSDPNNAAQTKDEWELHLKACDGVTLYYNHVVDIVPELKDEILKSPSVKVYGADARAVSIAWKAGMAIGKVARFDIGLVDTRKPALSFSNPVRYAANVDALLATLKPSESEMETAKLVIPRIIPQALFSRCALDYFEPGIKQTMYSLLASADGKTKVKGRPLCHSHMQDINGSAQGNWWSNEGAVNSFLSDEMALSLSNSNVDPSVPLFSLNGETPKGVQAGVYGFAVPKWPMFAKPVNRRFSNVTDLNIQCYEGLAQPNGGAMLGAVVLLQLEKHRWVTANRMRIEFLHDKKSCSELKTPWAFGPTAILLYR